MHPKITPDCADIGISSQKTPMLDRKDQRILECLQEDAAVPLAALAETVGLTRNPCWRRVQKLQADGVIRKTVALVDQQQVGLGITVFVHIRTNNHSKEWLQRFAAVINAIPEVVDFYRMSGDVDYMLKVVTSSMEAYDAVYKRMIESIDIYDVSSYFAMEKIKNTTALPLGHL